MFLRHGASDGVLIGSFPTQVSRAGPRPRKAPKSLCPILCPISIANRSKWAQSPGAEIAATGAEIQHDSKPYSKPSHSVRSAGVATVNRRVASSSLARGANLFNL